LIALMVDTKKKAEEVKGKTSPKFKPNLEEE
jgi:hypothetical protein